MRNLCEPDIDCWRRRDPEVIKQGGPGDSTVGAFRLPSPVDGRALEVGAGSGGGWDHVRVWRTDRIPDWSEMEYVKRLFFKANEIAMQLHVPPAEHINYHSHSLHLWRPHNTEIPRPPNELVWSWSKHIGTAPYPLLGQRGQIYEQHGLPTGMATNSAQSVGNVAQDRCA